ncbi:MAG: BglII/BstYI family type II restriction endonuclease [Nitrososphaerales archaeon]|jgi:hypothetical protein
MRVVSTYSHKNGKQFIGEHFQPELAEVYEVIQKIDASKAITKVSKEKTMPGRNLYAPIQLNRLFKEEFNDIGWRNSKINVGTSVSLPGGKTLTHRGFRDMDFVRHRLGVEVQFGKYAFMVYNVSAKMTIFNKQGIIDAGIEIVPMKEMADRMSTGVSFFEQFKTDLEMRGSADIDIPVLIVGIVE